MLVKHKCYVDGYGECDFCKCCSPVHILSLLLVDDSGERFDCTHTMCHECAGKYKSLVAENITPKLSPKNRGVKLSVKRQEAAMADYIGGVTTPASGAGRRKGDAYVFGKYRGEAKQTAKKSYPVKRSTLDKIRLEANNGEVPFLAIWFTGDDRRPQDKWVLIPESEWRKICGDK